MFRVIKFVALALAGVLFLLVSGLLALLLALQTDLGSNQALQWLLPRVNTALAGKIEVQQLRLSWREVTIQEVRLCDPEGETVAQIERVHLRWAPLELLHQHLEVHEATLEQPVLFFRLQESGESNLQRALADQPTRAKPRPSERPTQSNGWRFDVQRLQIVDGRVDVRRPGHTATSHWQAREVNAGIEGRFNGRTGGGFSLRAQVQAKTSEPIAEPLRVSLAAQGALARAGLSIEGNGEVAWGDSLLRFSGEAEQAGGAHVHIDELRIQPQLLRVFSPDEWLKATLVGHGDLRWDEEAQHLTADLKVLVGGAELRLEAVVATAPWSIRHLALHVRSLNLARLVRGGPPSQLELTLAAHAQGRDLDSLTGGAELRISAGVLGGYPMGPVRAQIQAENGRYRLAELSAALPGLHLTGSGQTDGRILSFVGSIEVNDLGKTVRAFVAGSSEAKVRASGRGHLAFRLSGPVNGPALRVRGQMEDLAWKDLGVPSLSLDVEIPDLTKPLASDLSLFASQVIYGSRSFHGVKVVYRASGPRFHAKVSVRPFATTLLEVQGRWNRSRSAVTLSSGCLRIRQARWELVGPSVFSVNKKAWRVSGLELQGPGEQRLRLEAERKGPALHADLWLSQLRLALLPAGVLPAPLKPAGQLNAEVHVRGRLSDPVADARLVLEHAEIDGLADIFVAGQVHLRSHRISGELQIEGREGRISSRFDLPTAWPPPAASPLSLELSALDLDLPLLVNRLTRSKLPNLTGLACLKVVLQGTGAHPNLALDLRLRELKLAHTPVGNLVLKVAAHDDQRISTQLEIHSISPQTGSGQLSLQTQLSLRDLIRRRFSLPKYASVPLRLDAHMKSIALAPVLALTGGAESWSGQVSLDATWEGTTAGGHGKLHLRGHDVVLNRYPPTEVVVDVESGEREQQARARLSRHDATLVALELGIQAPLSELWHPDRWPQLPVRMHALLGPLQVRREGLTAASYGEPSRVLQGRLQASLDLKGTLGAPQANAYLRFNDIRVDELVVGSIDLAMSYRDGRARGNLDVLTIGNGHWHSDALLVADLGYPAIKRGLGQAPLTGHVRATAFDVRGFSGLTPNLRTVAGKIFANLEVSGTIADPRPQGRFEWKDGELTIVGIGQYRKIHLLLLGDRESLSLEELKLESGSGNARITGRGLHRETGGYDIETRIRADKLPLYAEGQPLATLSMDAKARSQVSTQQIRATVEVSSARVVLKDANDKQLQKLSRPESVVLLEDGRPLNAEQKRKLAKINEQLGLISRSERPLASPEAKPPGAVITLSAPRDIWISGEDANLELSLRPDFRIEIGEKVQVFGKVEIRRGLITLLGQRFDLKESSNLVFGGAPDEPELDVTAIYDDWQNDTVVEITIKGTPEKLQIGIRAPGRPDLTESQLYTLVATGRLTVGQNTGSTSSRGEQAASCWGAWWRARCKRCWPRNCPLTSSRSKPAALWARPGSKQAPT